MTLFESNPCFRIHDWILIVKTLNRESDQGFYRLRRPHGFQFAKVVDSILVTQFPFE